MYYSATWQISYRKKKTSQKQNMAGRRHQPPTSSSRHRELPPNREPLHRLSTTVATSARSSLLEDRIGIQQREIQTLLLDNQRLAAAHVALKQELALSDQDIRHLVGAVAEVKAESEREVREVYERSLKMEAEVRGIEEVSGEILQVRGNLEKLREDRRELSEELDKINDEIAAANKEVEVLALVKGEIESLKREIQRGRAALEFEKKTTESNNEHEQTMEKNMIALAREIERLRAELSNAENRALEAAAAAAALPNPNAGYAGSFANPEVAFGGNPCPPDPYAMHQGGIAAAPPFVSGGMTSGSYDLQQSQTQMSMQAP